MPKRTPDKDGAAVLLVAEDLLHELADLDEAIEDCMADCGAELAEITAHYQERLAPLQTDKEAADKAILTLMKKNRAALFTAGDVVNLAHGSLIHSREDKVTIPRDALAKCQEQDFNDVVKVAYSLDREAVEKWTDAKLLLIGAERKPTEKFSYNIKEAEK